jgi:hypothetical protein
MMDDRTLLDLMGSANCVLETQAQLHKLIQLGRAEIVFSRLTNFSGVGTNVGASLAYAPAVIDARAAVSLDHSDGLETLSFYRCPGIPLRAPRRALGHPASRGENKIDGASTPRDTEGLRLRKALPTGDEGESVGVVKRRTGVTGHDVSGQGGSIVASAAQDEEAKQASSYESDYDDEDADEAFLATQRTPTTVSDPLVWFGPQQSPSIAKAQTLFTEILETGIKLANQRVKLARRLKSLETERKIQDGRESLAT